MGHLLILLIPLLGYSSCHVSLTFPPARDLNLDFLDNIRTPAPCGMPKGEAKMSVLAGSAFNVTWHLGYPHRGEHGYCCILVCVSSVGLFYFFVWVPKVFASRFS